jgi:hypothetical protein
VPLEQPILLMNRSPTQAKRKVNAKARKIVEGKQLRRLSLDWNVLRSTQFVG